MVDPDPILEPVEETFEEGELAPIIMAQLTLPLRPVYVGEGSNGRKRKRKKGNKECYEAAKARTTNNQYVRHAWFKWFAENVEHKDTFRRYNTPGTSMGIRRFVEHLCELGRQTDFKDDYEKWINIQVFKDWSDGSYKRHGETHIAGRLATLEGKASLLTKIECGKDGSRRARPVQLG
ncbi:hypothetical protein R1sor_017433 [Riccia sorocarpa]|uniref:Uncharacterized protein n=1 Tax=Riccia sorocarpa TaxID=122646 RepID=A0ABD3I773_9MARC